MTSWHKRNWLMDGTLLGWCRQCSLIPHDEDMDTGSWIEDFEDFMIPYFRDHPLLKLLWKLGRPDDSLEFKMGDTYLDRKTIDLFFMYPGPEKNMSWIGYQPFDEAHSKLMQVYPTIRHVCTADLHGYLVFVPCDALSLLRKEYGYLEWMSPEGGGALNFRENGNWLEGEWEGGEVYHDYQT